jgi:hypothetical protein
MDIFCILKWGWGIQGITVRTGWGSRVSKSLGKMPGFADLWRLDRTLLDIGFVDANLPVMV